MTEIRFEGRSDDQAYITGINIVEYDLPGQWCKLLINGVHVADAKLDYEGDWVTTIRSRSGYYLEVHPPDNPVSRWNDDD